MQDEFGDEPAVFLLGVAQQRQGAVVEFHDVLATVLGDEHLEGAQVQAAELLRHGVDPRSVALRHR